MFTFNTKIIPADYSEILEFGKGQAYTPDVGILERRSDWFLFVPDEMMQRHRSHNELGGSAFKTAEVLTKDCYSFWKKNLGQMSSAIALPTKVKNVPFTNIRGELYLIKSQHFFKLDTLRRNGVEFQRKRVKLKVPYRKAKKMFVQERVYYEWAAERTLFHEGEINAWMYEGVPDYWNDLLDGGFNYTPVTSFTPHNPRLNPYYYFTIKEYDHTSREPRTVFRLR